MFEHKYAKDLRLFHMEKLLINIKDLVNFVQMILVYGFTVHLAFTGEIAISSMVMHISAATGMVTASAAITQSIVDLKRVCQYSAPFFELAI